MSGLFAGLVASVKSAPALVNIFPLPAFEDTERYSTPTNWADCFVDEYYPANTGTKYLQNVSGYDSENFEYYYNNPSFSKANVLTIGLKYSLSLWVRVDTYGNVITVNFLGNPPVSTSSPNVGWQKVVVQNKTATSTTFSFSVSSSNATFQLDDFALVQGATAL